jgi:uncharacterized damage-inducible protein DinB
VVRPARYFGKHRQKILTLLGQLIGVPQRPFLVGFPGHDTLGLQPLEPVGLISPLVSWNLARRLFQWEGLRIIQLSEQLSTEQLTRRVLVPRQRAMEDSSRFWSPAMTIAHLVIVGDKVIDIMTRLGRGEHIAEPVRIEDVKPDAATLPAVLRDFRAFLARFDAQAGTGIQDRNSAATHAHPWVGPLTAHQWLNLAAVHQRVHRKQIQAILKHTGRQA